MPLRERRVWPKHRKFIEAQRCIVSRVDCAGDVVAAHVRSAANAGVGLKPHDHFTVPLCAMCHALQHQIGQSEFERRFGVNLMETARMFAERSPDLEMKADMRDHEKS